MKIAFVTFEYPPFILGGAGIYAQNVTEELAKLGHQITVFTPRYNDLDRNKYAKDNIQFVEIPINGFLPSKALQFWLLLPKAIKETDRKNKFDVIHFNSLSYWFLKKKLADAPHIVTIHHLVVDARKNNQLNIISRLRNIRTEDSLILPLFERLNIKRANRLIAVSNFTKERIIKIYKIPDNKIEVIYNGVDKKRYHFKKEELTQFKKQLQLNNNPIILFVGRVDDRRKGLDLLIRAIKIVLGNIDANLLIVGKGDQNKAKILAQKMNISSNIFFTGYIDDITLKKCYAICDLFVCPSRLEGFGLTILEALMMNKQVIATNVGSIPEVAEYSTNITLIDRLDPKMLGEAIINNLGDQKRTILITNNHSIPNDYLSEFNWEIVSQKLSHIYMGLCCIRMNKQ